MSQTHRRPRFGPDTYAPEGWRKFSVRELDSLSAQALDIALRLDSLEPVARGALLEAIRAELARMRRHGRARAGAHRAVRC